MAWKTQPGETTPPECLGNFAAFMYDENASPYECMRCVFAEFCHRVTSCDTLASIATNINLLVDNLIDQGQIKDYRDLCPDCQSDSCDGGEHHMH